MAVNTGGGDSVAIDDTKWEPIAPDAAATSSRHYEYAQRARSLRSGSKPMPDGTVATVKMATSEADGKVFAHPTLFQDEKGNFYESPDPFAEAKKRGELFDFGSDSEGANKFAQGSWKQGTVGPGAANPLDRNNPMAGYLKAVRDRQVAGENAATRQKIEATPINDVTPKDTEEEYSQLN